MKNHVPAYVKKAVVDLAIENPAQGQLRAFRNLNNVVHTPISSSELLSFGHVTIWKQ